MKLHDIIEKRHAAKLFTGEKISEENLEKLKEAIRLAPSSFNWQPWKIKIISDKKVLESLCKASYDQPQVKTASHLFVFCSFNNLHENNAKLLEELKPSMPQEKFDGFKAILDNALKNMSLEEQERMSERELFLAVQNLLLTATSLELGSCPMGGFIHTEYEKILNLPENLKAIVIVPVGVLADEPRPKFRFNQEDIFF